MIYREQEDPNYIAFIRNLVMQGIVYTLIDEEDSYAQCPSEWYDTLLGEPASVYCFWHNINTARACQKEEWANFKLDELPLENFMNDTLLDMAEDDHLVGIEFDEQLYGSEAQAMEVLNDLLEEIQAQHKQDEIETFDVLSQKLANWQAKNPPQKIIH